MIRLFLNYILTILLISFCLSSPVSAALDRGSCDKKNFDDYRRGINDELTSDGVFAMVLRANAPVFEDSQGTKSIKKLAFDTKLYIHDERGDKVQIRELSNSSARGWMDKQNLLCQTTPLLDSQTRIERKAFIRTEPLQIDPTNSSTNSAGVNAYEDENLSECPQGGCRNLSRFTMYFIVDETPQAVLLTNDFKLNDLATGLIGWVDKKHIIPWNTAMGLRPADNIKADDLADGAICLYEEERYLGQQDKCRRAQGGKIWYKLDVRLPLISHNNGVYKVAANYNRTEASISPASMVDSDIISKISNADNVDVFFLIDGTESMASWIKAIVGDDPRSGVVRQIKEELEGKLKSGAQVRFGFRIFKDTTNEDRMGLGKYMDFGAGSDCKPINATDIEKNHRDFQEELASVEATEVRVGEGTRDDYPENLFGGLQQTITDVENCPDYVKLIFVIGDAGYDDEAQRKRGVTPIRIKRLANRLDRLKNGWVFFIRTPKLSYNSQLFSTFQSYESYVSAWENYSRQALKLIEYLDQIAGDSSDKLEPEDFFFELSPNATASQDMLNKIVSTIDRIVQPEILDEIMKDIAVGRSLNEAIARARGNSKNTMPLFFGSLKESADCGNARGICDESFFAEVNYFYVSDQADLAEDVWMTSKELTNMTDFLREISNVDEAANIEMPDIRKNLAQLYYKNLIRILGHDEFDITQSVHEYVKRDNIIPAKFRGPLFAYNYYDLLGKNSQSTIDSCEIWLLISWLDISYQALQKVQEGTIKPVFISKEYDTANCPELSEKGKRLPFAPGGISEENLGKDGEYSYRRTIQYGGSGKVIYWVPKDFLP